jgi:hypothetical protein
MRLYKQWSAQIRSNENFGLHMDCVRQNYVLFPHLWLDFKNCTKCKSDLKLIPAIMETSAIRKSLTHLESSSKSLDMPQSGSHCMSFRCPVWIQTKSISARKWRNRQGLSALGQNLPPGSGHPKRDFVPDDGECGR